MPDIFSNRPGAVAILETPGFVPLRLDLAGFNPSTTKSIITQITINRRGRQQFMYTLRDFIYVYNFGEALGELTVSGIAFSEFCDVLTITNGPESVLRYYDAQRLSFTGKPVVAILGTYAMQAFLIGAKVGGDDPQQQLGSFSLQFVFPPSRTTAPILTTPRTIINVQSCC